MTSPNLRRSAIRYKDDQKNSSFVFSPERQPRFIKTALNQYNNKSAILQSNSFVQSNQILKKQQSANIQRQRLLKTRSKFSKTAQKYSSAQKQRNNSYSRQKSKGSFHIFKKTHIKNHTKSRSFSIDHNFTAFRKRKQYSQLQHSETNVQGLSNKDQFVISFTTLCFRLEEQYRQKCSEGKFQQAMQRLIIILNHSIDISSRVWFFKILYTMCQFYEVLEQNQTALKLYIQLKQASVSQKDYLYLIISLIGIAKCAGKGRMYRESIIVLKKALVYSWYIDNSELELNIYDQLGEKYYKMGDLEHANTYHKKFSNSILEEVSSPLRNLSKKQLQLLEQQHITHKYQNLSHLFLSKLNLPIKNTAQLPCLVSGILSSRQKMPELTRSVINPSYGQQISSQMEKLLENWMFQIENQEPNLQNVKQIQLRKSFYNSKKYAFIDFKLNQHLKRKGIKIMPKREFHLQQKQKQQKQDAKRKESLDQKIKRCINEPGLQKQWYENILKRVKYDQKRKLSQISDPIRVTKMERQKDFKHKKQILKHLFKQIIEFMSLKNFQFFDK